MDEGDTDTLRVEDRGSKPRRAHVLVEGVPADGVIDSGADLTFIGGDLFRRVSAGGKIKRRNSKKLTKSHAHITNTLSHWIVRSIWISHSAACP